MISDALTAPPDDAGWQSVALPHRSSKPAEHELVSYWYRLHFRPSDLRQQWLFFPKLRSGGTIFVNGSHLGQIRGADEMVQIRWFRPYLFYLPPSTIRAGDNVITVRLTIREPLTSFGAVALGPEQPLRDSYDAFFFWENTSTLVKVDVVFGPEFLRIQVKDDGIGFAGEVKPFGRGMVNMRSRARKIGGMLRVGLSGPGASIQLDIPLSAICAPPSSVSSEAEASLG